VSRYKVFKWSDIYPGIVILLTAVVWSGFVKHYYPVLVAGVKAKTMTSLLIIPALLAKVMLFFCHHAVSIKKAESLIFFLSLGSILVQKRVDYNLSD
jgi:hypothetical protein